MNEKDAKFTADIMLGKLAKWLRILGYDCLYFSNINKFDLIKTALYENRIILTRNTRLKDRKIPPVIFIKNDNWKKQLKEVIDLFPINYDKIFSRCIVCNQILESIEKDKVKDFVPPYVFETSKKFSYCLNCKKYYWEGTHINHVKNILFECK
jgi:uncharacterized protein with PIN domain